MDMALAKRTYLVRERLSSELRLEAFNLFNSVQFRDATLTAAEAPVKGGKPPGRYTLKKLD